MTEQLTLLWLGTVALATTMGGVAVSAPKYQRGESSFGALIAYPFGLVFWLLFTAESFSYFVATGGETVTQSSEGMAVVGAIGAVITLVLLFDTASRTLDIF
jgi:hypothetical protein